MSIFDTKISYFRSTTDTEVAGQYAIGEALIAFRDGKYKEQIQKLRSGNESIKKYLPTMAMHGIFKHFRKASDFVEASGIVILDIDDVEIEDIVETKQDIMDSSNHVLAVMTSPSGTGIKVLYYVEPDLVNKDSYRLLGKNLISNFTIYGNVDVLSLTDCLIATYDPHILINEDVVAELILIEPIEVIVGQLEKLDDTKTLWDDAEDFFETVLSSDIAQKTNNNFHYIQVAILDLAKYGFTHPAEDLSFVIDYAESEFKQSNNNKQRFLEIVEISKGYCQTKWAYKLFLDTNEQDDEYVDYSDFKVDQNSEEQKQVEVEFDGLIDYDTLWSRCIVTMAEGNRVGYEVALKNLADALRFKGTGIITITGIPGHGKTEFVDAILIDLARLYGQQSLIAGFEQEPEQHIIKLMRKMIGADITCETYRDDRANIVPLKNNFDFIIKHFKHIDVSKLGGNVNEILKYCAEIIRVQREVGNDPKYLVLDPFNMLSIKGRFSGHEKIEEILRRITHFSHQMGILVFLVAHPFKMRKDEKTGQYDVPDFYSVKGSSAFFEMSYHGLVIYRNQDGTVLVKVLKVKQNNLGTTGAEVLFYYEKLSGRYIPIDEEGIELSGDHRQRSWLDKVK